MWRRRLFPIVPMSLALGALVFAPACRKKAPTTAQQTMPTPAAPAPAAAPPAAAPASAPAPDVLSQDLDRLNRAGYLKDAFFDYDRSELRDDARQALAADSEWLKKYPSVRILVEGHCDERGTEAYNLALGERRAQAAQEYLAALGVSSSRVKVVSYGKERPFCNEATDHCYQENRRGHVVITAK
ncbi:MAG: peptidoglycan-associated lipoprotein Pal [Acidobacteriota bacterium]